MLLSHCSHMRNKKQRGSKMTGRNNYEKNPLRMVIYILAVIVLVGCIVYLLKYSGMKQEKYREEVKRVSALEASDLAPTPEADTSSETAMPEATATLTPTPEAAVPGATPTPEVSATLTPIPEAAVPGVTSTPEAANLTPAPELEKQADTVVNAEEAAKEMSILVLNGTRRPGVAAYWKNELDKSGYKNVTPVTYTKIVEFETVIMTENVELAQPLLELFPDAKIQEGSVQEGIELDPGVTIPEKSDVYIIIGEKDVRM